MGLRYRDQIQGSNLQKLRAKGAACVIVGAGIVGYLWYNYSPFMKRFHRWYEQGVFDDSQARIDHRYQMRLGLIEQHALGGTTRKRADEIIEARSEFKDL